MIHVWYIYLYDWIIYGVNVAKYISTMHHLGTCDVFLVKARKIF